MRIVSIIIIIITISLIIIACSQSYIVNTNVNTDYPEGRNLYLSKCGGCHNYFDPNTFTKTDWSKIMATMQQKSKINDQQKKEILNWILETQNHTRNLEAKN